jgi:ribosomal protein S18 acetylase RimI-like enzyme
MAKAPHRIRRAQPEDAKRLSVLATQVFLHTYATDGISSAISEHILSEITPAAYSTLLTNPAVFTSVAEQGDNLLGFAVIHLDSVCPDADDAMVELQTLYVQEHFAGKGIGHGLLTKVQELAHVGANSRLWLTVNAKNARAISFYQRQGYRTIGTTDFFLGGVGHENKVMVGPALNHPKEEGSSHIGKPETTSCASA